MDSLITHGIYLQQFVFVFHDNGYNPYLHDLFDLVCHILFVIYDYKIEIMQDPPNASCELRAVRYFFRETITLKCKKLSIR